MTYGAFEKICSTFLSCYNQLIVIDWLNLLFSSLWIIGCAIELAAVSYHHWAASENNVSLKEQFNQRSFQLASWVSILLICAGIAGTTEEAWEKILWIILGVSALINIVIALRTDKNID